VKAVEPGKTAQTADLEVVRELTETGVEPEVVVDIPVGPTARVRKIIPQAEVVVSIAVKIQQGEQRLTLATEKSLLSSLTKR
jgi:precorrin isomerase